MAEVNPPAFLQGRGDHSAEVTRLMVSSMLGEHAAGGGFGGRGGVHPDHGNRMQVTQTGSPSMAVVVRSGTVFVPGSQGAKQGMYVCHNDADKTVAIGAAPGPGQSRIDIVQARVRDAAYSGASNDFLIDVKAGTAAPTGTQVMPSADANAVILAFVTINNGMSSITNANITWWAPYAHSVGGYTEVANSFYNPPSATIRPGQRIHNLSTQTSYLWNSTSGTWEAVVTARVGTYTPSVPSGFNLGATGARTGRYRLLPQLGLCYFSADFKFEGAGWSVPAANNFNVDLPPGIPPSGWASGSGFYDWQNRGLWWRCLTGASTAFVATTTGGNMASGTGTIYMAINGFYPYA
jgi:hypothetical protein